ncbi:MAG: hypothetical protein JW993_00525 [Sedimentisphaerales bacterium]|nr:hypothetical protein [Sedimentisphaerales bacterium]
MIGDSAVPFSPPMAAIPTYARTFGQEANVEDLVALLKRYPATEWLSFLSRVQNMLCADRFQEKERIHRVICGTMGKTVCARLKELGFLDGEHAIYYERQLSTLQQLAVLYAPETGPSRLENNEGRDDLSMALLMTADIMMANRSSRPVLELLIQDQIRMATTPPEIYATRAFYLYELDQAEPSTEVSKYLGLFEQASGVSAPDCVLGGLAIIAREQTRSLDDIANAWHSIPRSQQCENPKEGRLLSAYEAVRMRSLSELRALIEQRECNRPIRDWNLIALSQAPICDLENPGAFVLNHTVVGRSLFDSIRHEVLTAARDGRLPEPYTNVKAVGDLYGKIFEKYILSIFRSAYGDQVWRIPEDNRERRADFLVWFPDKVVVVEVKSSHFIGLSHASLKSTAERQEELEKIGIPIAVDQLTSTIDALRRGDIVAPTMPAYDWTITPIIPLIVSEEQMPQVPGCWNALYRPLCSALDETIAVGPLGRLRLLPVGHVERLPDLQAPLDLATMLYQWGSDRDLAEWPWDSFLSKRNVTFSGSFMPGRFRRVVKFLARRLGLDETRIG